MAWGKRKPRGTRVIDRFAQALSETGDVQASAAGLGLDRNYANSLFAKIKRELGPQAI